MISPRATARPQVSSLRTHVDTALRAFIERRRPELLAVGEDVTALLSALEVLLASGKRLRPAFCYWGWRGAGGDDIPEIVHAAASLELLQASALIHDDVVDASDTRRGQPAAHRRFERLHRESGWQGSAEAFGTAAAILLGDLSLTWADQMYHASGLPAAARARGQAPYDLMRTELMCGQYLDVLEQARAEGSVDTALRVTRFKSAKYTVERPLHVGAALAGADPAVIAAYTAYGLPLGVAFQLRDDVLGVFGDPAETGKPAGDDLREGKRTVLVAMTLERAVPARANVLRQRLGDPALTAGQVDELRTIITECGALDACETLIQRYADEAHAALATAPITGEARAALADLAVDATARRG